ncbi:MAG: hypothetical protein NZM37_12345 [Sandaracinaceae bacterium]|nr:hypothetical protein [Sandaracinaceae bacterium]MDW8246031.1 hypothetical protein [Sandaracinaceae bacterium]
MGFRKVIFTLWIAFLPFEAGEAKGQSNLVRKEMELPSKGDLGNASPKVRPPLLQPCGEPMGGLDEKDVHQGLCPRPFGGGTELIGTGSLFHGRLDSETPLDFAWVMVGVSIVGVLAFAGFGACTLFLKTEFDRAVARIDDASLSVPERMNTVREAEEYAERGRTFSKLADFSLIVSITSGAAGLTLFFNHLLVRSNR